ncbi:sigma-54-dependent Fis family transcriptional regulator [Halobacillus sp. Marseille-P3879]|uniref:sigma-54-dependent Fis family transcriptional regulator n=1 Tax=Halobacillus sp. Marseille-P3879 TaxID=2045014 RepID=UPI000C797D21|nr:sigma-54-dependent transcriptional regulator [Halobacillus sp. Marseille-P3879]
MQRLKVWEMINILVIAPYQGLAQIAKSYQNYDEELKIDIKTGNLEAGVEIAKTAESEGYDIIISRGGTASLIEEQTSVPVVDIKISGYDMLRIFTLLRGTNGKAALVGFSNISRGASTICSILDMEVKTITINSGEEVTAHLDGLKRKGYSVVIGDVVTVQQAEKIGLQGILITSGKEAVLDSFEEAKRLFYLFQGMQSQASVYSEAVEHFPQPMITLNKQGEVVFKNYLFREYLDEGIIQHSQFQELLDQVFFEEKEVWKTVAHLNINYQLRGYPLNGEEKLVNVIIYKDFLVEEEGIKVHSRLSHIKVSGKSPFAKNMRGNLGRFAKMRSPLWIEGEQGTGKMLLAGNLHFETYGHRVPLITINLQKVSVEQLYDRFTSQFDRLPKEGTIVLLNIHELDKGDQLKIKIFVQRLTEYYKVIIVSNDGMAELVRKKQLEHDLYYKLPNTLIYLPPLADRLEDLKDLVQAFITQSHMNYGNETIGIRENALSKLLEYPWPGNIDQLKKMVEKLIAISDTSYIELKDVEKTLQEIDQPSSEEDMENIIEIDGTLKDMEKRIIQQVMKQENNNQSKVAKRLGINRTTLWRKLNS